VYLPTTTARSPLMVPGSDFCGSVAPISFLPYLITPSPSQTCIMYRARAKEVTQSIEERSVFQIMIVLLSKFFGWNHQLDGNKLESFSFKSGQYLRNLPLWTPSGLMAIKVRSI
uniref:Uncharacterized protein n=1 Tax=Oryza brachyantha TaxID=4533 RepID=J3MAE1_ORYBR